MLDYQYSYLLLDLILGLFWIFLFLRRKDLRRELYLTSFVWGICGPIAEIIYLRDYWHPQLIFGQKIKLEDFLFGFFIGGIASVLYKELFHKHLSKNHDHSRHWSWFAPSFVAIGITLLSIFVLIFQINSIYASIFMFGILTLIIIFYRHDLLLESLASGIGMVLVTLFLYIVLLKLFPELFVRLWLLKNLTGVFIFGIPVEELWWAFFFGLFAGPLYEFFEGLRLRKSV